MKCSRIIECKSSAGWARGCAPINIWVFTLHSFIAWDTEQSQLRARDTRGIKWRSSTERALASECLVTTWCNLQPVSVSRYQECVTESCVPGNGYSSAIRDDLATNLYNCRMKYPPTFIFVWPMTTLSDHPSVGYHVITQTVIPS